MGDHEVIVAQIARQSLQTGQWLVPHYLDTTFLVKPPLAPWLAGTTSWIAEQAETAFGANNVEPPVSSTTARLPSVIATLLTALIVFRLGASMYGRRTGFMAAFIFANCLGAMLFAFNATAEALLTLFCTWAFAEFWWAQRSPSKGGRILHMALFYVAFGLAMLAKGPMPLMLVATPIALWWWCSRPTRLLAAGGVKSTGAAVGFGLRDALPRLWSALKSLGLWWGVPIFLAMFLPWMFAVAKRVDYAWDLWNYEYLDRLKGDYPGCKTGRYYYYIPIVFGLMIPWLLSMPEALAAPFLRKYSRDRKPLIFAWYWVVVGVAITSMMSFKKPYYIIPVIPGCALLLAPVLREFFFRPTRLSMTVMRRIFYAIMAFWAIGWGVMWFVAHDMYPEIWHGPVATYSPLFVVVLCLAIGFVGWLYLQGRRYASFLSLGVTSCLAFVAAWCMVGPVVDNTEDPLDLVAELRKTGIPPDTQLYWASNRPDGRVAFYGNLPVRQVINPYELVAQHSASEDDEFDLLTTVGSKICTLLEGSDQIYMVFQRGQLHMLRTYFRPTPPAFEVLSIDRGKVGEDADDWVVVTNRAQAASRASS